MNNTTHQYPTVQNVPIGCMFCGAQIFGKITERIDSRTKETTKECRWQCSRCGNISKIGKVE